MSRAKNVAGSGLESRAAEDMDRCKFDGDVEEDGDDDEEEDDDDLTPVLPEMAKTRIMPPRSPS